MVIKWHGFKVRPHCYRGRVSEARRSHTDRLYVTGARDLSYVRQALGLIVICSCANIAESTFQEKGFFQGEKSPWSGIEPSQNLPLDRCLDGSATGAPAALKLKMGSYTAYYSEYPDHGLFFFFFPSFFFLLLTTSFFYFPSFLFSFLLSSPSFISFPLSFSSSFSFSLHSFFPPPFSPLFFLLIFFVLACQLTFTVLPPLLCLHIISCPSL